MKSTGKYKVILIEEGLGNLQSLFFYTREALQYAVDNKVFDGKKAFADHPSKFEDATRPERSVRDVIGHYEDCEVVDGDAGQAQLQANLITIDGENYDWARCMIEAALAYSGKFDSQLIGLSINASGNSEKKGIDNIIADETLPVSVKPKLLLAKSEGATEIEYCTQLQEAVSVDLVTEAGARGRIVKMIESERAYKMAKTAKELEQEKLAAKKLKEAADAAAAKTPPTDDAGGDDDHADADKDKELISSMLKKHIGGDEHSEEEHQAMKQAYENAKEMGLEGEEAQNCAGNSMKMAHHIAQKQKKEKEATTDAGASDVDKKAEAEEKKESAAIRARVATLEAELTASKVQNLLTKTIRESGFEGKVEKAFLKALGTPKTEKEVTETAKVFKEALVASGSTEFYNPEKAAAASSGSGFSLANCVKGDN